MICPCCGAAELVYGKKDQTYHYKDQQLTVEAVEGDWCPACNDGLLTTKSPHSDVLAAFIKRVNCLSPK